jgi:hypothetical protein
VTSPAPNYDARFENHGSIWLCRLLTEPAHDWVASNVSDEAQWYGEALVVEPRYVETIVTGMRLDGLTVGGPQ